MSLGLKPAAPVLALAALAALAACNKQPSSHPSAAPETVTAPTPMSDADKQAALAKLPAPYATADLANGESKFALCSTCHSLPAGAPNMTGPNLHGIFGRKAGTVPGFSYSDVLKASGWTWDAARIDTWITDPKVALPGTKMTFAGLKDPKDRTDTIAYLMVMSGYQP